MPTFERALRMRELRRVVAGHDVFLWAGDILDSLETLPRDLDHSPMSVAGRDPVLRRRLAEGAGSNVRG